MRLCYCTYQASVVMPAIHVVKLATQRNFHLKCASEEVAENPPGAAQNRKLGLRMKMHSHCMRYIQSLPLSWFSCYPMDAHIRGPIYCGRAHTQLVWGVRVPWFSLLHSCVLICSPWDAAGCGNYRNSAGRHITREKYIRSHVHAHYRSRIAVNNQHCDRGFYGVWPRFSVQMWRLWI